MGDHAKTVTKNTDDEMVEVLRSEESLKLFSNYHDVLAIANLYNIKIRILSYGGHEGYWREVCPDPKMANTDVTWVPDMALYHASEVHYDLLVEDDSRLAKVGLNEAMNAKENAKAEDEAVETSTEEAKIYDNSWEVFSKKKDNKLKANINVEAEKLIQDDPGPQHEDVVSDKDDLIEEEILIRNNNSGHRRTAPQTSPEKMNQSKAVFSCDKCDYELESQGLLDAHLMNHEIHKPKYYCESCDQDFRNNNQLAKHIETKHTNYKSVEEWNCNDCSFQANCASELLKHLKLSAHQPSKKNDVKQCYTCKLKFEGYFNLMNHRKISHPSSKKCRNPSWKLSAWKPMLVCA